MNTANLVSVQLSRVFWPDDWTGLGFFAWS
jgi:hypothetical protein